MLYDLECKCGEVTEFSMGMNDGEIPVECPKCDGVLTRKNNQVFLTVPYLQGVHCAGATTPDYNGYYDEGMGTWITSKQHRAEEMRTRGLTEYNPDPTMKKHRDEAAKIRKNSRPGDPDAQAAIRKEYKTAENKRRTKLIGKSLEKSFKDVGI